MGNEDKNIRECQKLIEETLRWGNSDEWGVQDFETLTDKIFQKTNVRLSVSTIKRIWGKVKYDSSPTLNTLNTLARFIDFPSWRDFQNRTALESKDSPDERVDEIATADQSDPARINWKFNWPAVGLIVVAGLGFIAMFAKSKSEHHFKFKSHKVSNNLPNSVIFDYEIPPGISHEVFIQQSWDPEKRKRVSPEGRQHTSIYYRPGYFRAKLIVDGRIEKEDSVFIQTKGWRGIIESMSPPVYLSNKEVKLVDGLGLDDSMLTTKIGSQVFNEKWVSFSNVREFGVSGRDFTFEASVKNTSTVEESACRKVKIVLLGKDGAIVIPLATMGCVSSIDLGTNEQGIRGTEHDLSGFGCSYSDFENIRCTVYLKKISIYHNDKLIHSSPHIYSIGEVIGMRVMFEGAGIIKDIKLSDTRGFAWKENFQLHP